MVLFIYWFFRQEFYEVVGQIAVGVYKATTASVANQLPEEAFEEFTLALSRPADHIQMCCEAIYIYAESFPAKIPAPGKRPT